MPKKPLLLLILLIAVLPSLRLLLEFRHQPYLGIIHDDSVYWITAKSLGVSGDYRIESLPEQPYQTKYPPLYPLFLSWVWKANPEFPGNLTLALTAQWLLFPAMLWTLFHFLGSLKLDPWVRVFLCVLIAVNPYVGFYGMMLVSEMLFLTLFLASSTCVVLSRNRDSIKLAAVAGLLASAAYLTRVAGLPLLPAGALFLIISRRYRPAVAFSAAMIPAVLGWTLWSHTHALRTTEPALLMYTSYSGDYLSSVALQNLPAIIWTNWARLASAMAALLIPNVARIPAGQQLAYLLIAASIAGAVRLAARHGWTPMHFFALAYSGILLAWNWTPSERMTLPLLPLMLAGVATEVEHIASMVSKAASKPWMRIAVPAGAALVFLSTNLYMHWTLVPWLFQSEHEALERNRGAYRWITENTGTSTTFMTWSDVVLYLNTSRHAIRPPQARIFEDGGGSGSTESALSEWSRFAERTGAYLFLSTSDMAGDQKEERLRSLSTMVMAKTHFRPLYQTPQSVILRLEAKTQQASTRGATKAEPTSQATVPTPRPSTAAGPEASIEGRPTRRQ